MYGSLISILVPKAMYVRSHNSTNPHRQTDPEWLKKRIDPLWTISNIAGHPQQPRMVGRWSTTQTFCKKAVLDNMYGSLISILAPKAMYARSHTSTNPHFQTDAKWPKKRIDPLWTTSNTVGHPQQLGMVAK
ncbi:hypothetical protein GOBAR_DD19128 [Gossypium barbadense]|nr:hypothetical protein GOBAR_DD19128 [Gossypium barbadense]